MVLYDHQLDITVFHTFLPAMHSTEMLKTD